MGSSCRPFVQTKCLITNRKTNQAMYVPTSTKSFKVAMARSGCPRREAVVAAPLLQVMRDAHVEKKIRHQPLIQACEACFERATSAYAITDAGSYLWYA